MIIDIIYRGIDDFNRPVYKAVKYPSVHFGMTNKLFTSEPKKEVDQYFNEHKEDIEYFGDRFNCEPYGGMPFKGTIEFNIIT